MSSKLDFRSAPSNSPSFELVIEILDSQGNPTGKRKSYGSDDADKVSNFWQRNKGNYKKKKKKTQTATKEEADKILKEMYKNDKDMNSDVVDDTLINNNKDD